VQLAANRYEIRRELGRGGTGIVYEAFDAKDRALVALKTIESARAEDLYRLKHEFRALADLQHPNLVRFGELTCGSDGKWFFTMELVDGSDFVTYVRGPSADANPPAASAMRRLEEATTGELVSRIAHAQAAADQRLGARARPGSVAQQVREERLRSALAQVVSALATVHDAGRVHRDVKPSNVLVSREGRVVVLDFGLASAFRAADAAEDNDLWVVGTPAYMSPEQVEGGHIGPAADWYALGVMLYVTLTGAFPFDPADVLAQKFTRAPPSPLILVPGLPPDLCELAVDLLAVDKRARPGHGEIVARLESRGRTPSASFGTSESAGPPFVGRREELRHLEAIFERVANERSARSVLVEGEPGIGKSSLVREFTQARPGGVLLLSGRCYEQEDVPFKGIDSVIDALSEHLVSLADADARVLLSHGIRYLTTLFPVLLRVPVISDTSASMRAVGNPAAVREQGFRELEELFGALASRSPVIVFVDDLQWADRDSIAVVRRMLAVAVALPLLFVATMRTGAEVAPEIASFAAEAERISLRGLSADEARALLDVLWRERGSGGSGASKDGFILEADGHPLFLAELVRSAADAPSSRAGAFALEQVLWERIQARDVVDRRFLEVVAVAGAPIPYDVAAAAAEVHAGEVQTRLGSLRAAQLARVSRRGGERTVEAYHDRVRESVVRRLLAAEGGKRNVALIHYRLARALLENAPPDALRDNVFAIAQHFNAARETIDTRDGRLEAASIDLLAGREALRATAYERAQGYARAGLAFLGDEGWSHRYELARDLCVALMWAEAFADDAAGVEGAARAFEEARARARSEADKTALWFEWISILTMRRKVDRALEAGRDHLAELGFEIPQAITRETLRTQREAIRALQAGRTAQELLALPDLRSEVHEAAIRTIVALIPVAFFKDALLRAWLHMSVVLLSLEHGLCDAAPYSLSGYGTILRGVFGEYEEAAAFGRAAFALHERLPDTRFAARLVFHYGGWHAPWIDSYARAKEMLRNAHDLARQHGDTTHEMYASAILSVITFCESANLTEVEATATWAADLALRRKDYDMAWVPEAHARYASALRSETGAGIDLGRPESSDADFRSRLGPETPTGLFYYLFCNAELAYLARAIPRAAELLRAAGAREQVISGLPMMFEIDLLRCLVAAKLHDSSSDEERGRLIAEIEERVSRLSACAAVSPPSFQPQALMASAELARVRGLDGRALYERAWTVARTHGAPKREALALELGAEEAQARGDEARAEDLRAQAVVAYTRWGATAKARALGARRERSS
jgi:predicted ATPase/serine/threonine protein kinase